MLQQVYLTLQPHNPIPCFSAQARKERTLMQDLSKPAVPKRAAVGVVDM